jgi:PAS domain S-box-containing protein
MTGIGTYGRVPILVLLVAASIAVVLVLLYVLVFRRRGKAVRGNRQPVGLRLEEMRAVLEGVGAGIFVQRDGRVLFANDWLHHYLGWDPGALAGAPLGSLAQEEAAGVLSTLGPDPSLPREIELVRRDGASVWAQAAGAALVLDDGPAMLVSIVDVCARRESEERRRELAELARRQEEQLEHSTRLAELGEMAAAISHELNQPLTGIRNYARNAYYMLEQKPGAEADIKTNLRLISEQVDRAAKIINQMRELTRRADSVFLLLEVNSVIRETVDFLLPQMKLSEVSVSLNLDDSLPQIWGDRIRLAQVFLNLLSNARQAMEDAPVRTLTISSRFEPADPLPVVLEVGDTGKGFGAEQARRLFQPFYTTRKAGHGLGLSISRAIVQDHQGSLGAVGTPGAGATFTIRLPLARNAMAHNETNGARRGS